MININTKEVEKEVEILKNLIEDYEKNYITLFKELSDSSYYWKNDGNAKKFFNGIKYEKDNEDSYYKALHKTYKVFEYVCNKYKQIGEKIYINIDEKGNILAKFNKCINETTELIVLYEHLDTSFCPYERALIINQIKRLNNLRTKYKTTKQKVKETIEKIISIENEVKTRLANYEVDKVSYFDENSYLGEV